MIFRQRFRHRHLGAGLALVAGDEGAKHPYHLAYGEETSLLGDDAEEFRREPADFRLFENRRERVFLFLGGEYRALHQALQIFAVFDPRVEAVEIGPDGIKRLLLERELVKRGRITARHAGYDRFVSHDQSLGCAPRLGRRGGGPKIQRSVDGRGCGAPRSSRSRRFTNIASCRGAIVSGWLFLRFLALESAPFSRAS